MLFSSVFRFSNSNVQVRLEEIEKFCSDGNIAWFFLDFTSEVALPGLEGDLRPRVDVAPVVAMLKGELGRP